MPHGSDTSPTTALPATHDAEALGRTVSELLQATIRPTVARVLRVSLHADDGRERNQDALDVCQEVIVRLLAVLDDDARREALTDLRGYAARASYTTAFDYLRARRRGPRQLHDRLRYHLSHRSAFAVWTIPDGEVLSGLREWRDDGVRASTNRDAITTAMRDPASLPLGPLPTDLEAMRGADWERVLLALFRAIDGPVPLVDLVRILGNALGIARETVVESLDAAPNAIAVQATTAFVDRTEAQERDASRATSYARLWHVLGEMNLRWRRAYLLHCDERELDLQDMVDCGAVRVRDIGQAVALTDEEYETLWIVLPLDDAQRAEARCCTDAEVRFMVVWVRLPLEDRWIAEVMGLETYQVSNLRFEARKRFVKRLRPEVVA